MAVKLAKRISKPLTAPTTNAPTNISAKPAAMASGDRPSLMKNEATTTRKPASGPTERSMPRHQHRNGLPERDEAQRRRQHQDVVDVERRKEVGVLREDIEAEQAGDERQRNGGRIVRLQKMPPSARSARLARALGALARVGFGGDGGGDDLGFDDVLAGQGRRDAAARHHHHLIAQALQLRSVGGIDDDRRAGARDLAQDAVDLEARADVDALRRFVRHDEAGLAQQRPRHHHLLLVAARKRQDRRFEACGLDRQRVEGRRDLPHLLASVEDAVGREFVERGEGRVLAHRQAAGETLDMPVGGHEGGFFQKLRGIEPASLQPDRAARRLEAGERAHEFGLPIAGDAGNAHDLGPRRLEADAGEFVAAERLH